MNSMQLACYAAAVTDFCGDLKEGMTKTEVRTLANAAIEQALDSADFIYVGGTDSAAESLAFMGLELLKVKAIEAEEALLDGIEAGTHRPDGTPRTYSEYFEET